MANTNTLNKNKILTTNGNDNQLRTEGIISDINPGTDADTGPDEIYNPPRPRPDDGEHNDDQHHHHEHNHIPDDGDSLAGGPSDDEVFDPDSEDLIDIENFQSEIFNTNKITITDSGEEQILEIKDIGMNEDDSFETANRIIELINQFPIDGDNSALNVAIEVYHPNGEVGVGPYTLPQNLTITPEFVVGPIDGQYLNNLEFPTYFEEFNVDITNQDLNPLDAIQWVGVGRPDVAAYITAYIQGGSEAGTTLQEFEENYDGYTFTEEQYSRAIGQQLLSTNGNDNLLNTFYYYSNASSSRYFFSIKIPTEEFLSIGTFLPTEGMPTIQFKLVGSSVQYEDVSFEQLIRTEITNFENPNPYELFPSQLGFIQQGNMPPFLYGAQSTANKACEVLGFENAIEFIAEVGPPGPVYWDETNIEWGTVIQNNPPKMTLLTCIPYNFASEPPDDGTPGEEDPLNYLIDSSLDDEEISDTFGVPGFAIQQTLFNQYDVLSGMDININTFKNTKQGLIDSDGDGRISLGLFSFDEDNILTDNFQSDIRDTKFKQITKPNLVSNGSGQFIKSIWNNKSDYNDPRREKFFIPAGDWGYCTFDAVGPDFRKRREDLYGPLSEESPFQNYGNFIEGRQNGPEFIDSFEQHSGFNGSEDTQGVVGYAGYYPYFFDYRTGINDNSILRLQHNFITASDMTENSYDVCNKFFQQNQVDSIGKQWGSPGANIGEHNSVSTHKSYIIPSTCEAVGKDNPNADDVEILLSDVKFPNFAKWIIDKDFDEDGVSCYSYGRCLEFFATNFKSGQYNFNDNDTLDDEIHNFSWTDTTLMNDIIDNQYRSLNQVIKIHTGGKNSNINPFTVMEVKFKMKTWSQLYYEDTPPQVELSIIDGDGYMQDPRRIEDRVGFYGEEEGPQNGYYPNSVYWPHGDFNSQRYSDDLNSTNTLDRKYSNFGSMGRFQNTKLDTWETFSYKFTISEIFRYSTGKIRDLHLLIQSAGTFYGRVWLDDFEVYESQDFIPDVDVRKKISVGNYGKANLTEYYDPMILSQLEKYHDTTAPLEAQFYFYPQYPSDEIFNVKRTPVYQDFKKGLFYIYDVDWGDGSPKEFTSEPEQIDEEKALYHTYETSGIFEVTGVMLRSKIDDYGNEQGIIKNKKFTLIININEGLDEDFQYFGSDGFSFIPYKNTLPIIGGYSEQSAYYKGITRQLGLSTYVSGYQDNEVITDYQSYADSPDPYELIPGLIEQFQDEGILDDLDPRYFYCDDATMLQFCSEMGYEKANNINCNANIYEETVYWDSINSTWGQIDFVGDKVSSVVCVNTSIVETEVIETIKTNIEFKNDSDKLKLEIALDKMDSSFTTELDLLNEYKIPRTLLANSPTEPVCETYECGINDFLHPTNYFDPPIQFSVITCHPDDELCFEKHPGLREHGDRPFTEQVLGDVGDSAWNLQGLPDDGNGGFISRMYEGVTYRFLELMPDYQGEFCHPALGCEGFGTSTGIPFAGGGSYQDTNGDFINDTVNPPYFDFTIPISSEIAYSGLRTNSDELGKSIGDLNITNIKYYNTPKSIWELFGFGETVNQEQIDEPFEPEELITTEFFNLSYFNPNISDNSTDNLFVYSDFSGTMRHYTSFGWFGALAGGEGLADIYLINYQSEIDEYIPGQDNRIQITNTNSETIIEFSHPLIQTLYWYEKLDDAGNYSDLKSGNKINLLPGQIYEIIIPLTKNTMMGIIGSDKEVAIPNTPRYWKNIIPQDYSIYNRDGILGDEYYTNYYGSMEIPEADFKGNRFTGIPPTIELEIEPEQEFDYYLQNLPWLHNPAGNLSRTLKYEYIESEDKIRIEKIIAGGNNASELQHFFKDDYGTGLGSLYWPLGSDHQSNPPGEPQYHKFTFTILDNTSPGIAIDPGPTFNIRADDWNRENELPKDGTYIDNGELIFSDENNDGVLRNSVADCRVGEECSIWIMWGYDDSSSPKRIKFRLLASQPGDVANIKFSNLYMSTQRDSLFIERNGLPPYFNPVPVDIYSEQEWLDGYYYPVLPKYGANGEFIDGNFPNNKIPFPIEGPITNENEFNKNLLINITSENIEANVFNDKSGNQNLGFGIIDYKPEFDNKTLQPKKIKNTTLIKKSKNNGAF